MNRFCFSSNAMIDKSPELCRFCPKDRSDCSELLWLKSSVSSDEDDVKLELTLLDRIARDTSKTPRTLTRLTRKYAITTE